MAQAKSKTLFTHRNRIRNSSHPHCSVSSFFPYLGQFYEPQETTPRGIYTLSPFSTFRQSEHGNALRDAKYRCTSFRFLLCRNVFFCVFVFLFVFSPKEKWEIPLRRLLSFRALTLSLSVNYLRRRRRMRISTLKLQMQV